MIFLRIGVLVFYIALLAIVFLANWPGSFESVEDIAFQVGFYGVFLFPAGAYFFLTRKANVPVLYVITGLLICVSKLYAVYIYLTSVDAMMAFILVITSFIELGVLFMGWTVGFFAKKVWPGKTRKKDI